MTVKNTVAAEQFKYNPPRIVGEKEKSQFADKDSITGTTQTGRAKVVLFFDEDDPLLQQFGV